MGLKGEKLGKATTPPSAAKLPLLDAAGVAWHWHYEAPRPAIVTERRIPFVKVGRFVRFDPAELDVWLDAQRVAAVTRHLLEVGPRPGGKVVYRPGGLEQELSAGVGLPTQVSIMWEMHGSAYRIDDIWEVYGGCPAANIKQVIGTRVGVA